MLLMVGLIFEFIDLVCGIINLFFGKMGYVIVCVVCEVGVEVMLVFGLMVLEMFYGV